MKTIQRVGLGLLIFGFITTHTEVQAVQHTIPEAIEAIESDENSGVVSSENAAKYRANLVIKPELNPEPYQGTANAPVKCGLPLWEKILADWDLLDDVIQTKLMDIQNRPAKQHIYDTPQGRFKLHYDTQGGEAVFQPTVDQNNNSIPDYVERVGLYFEESWSLFDSLGYDEPPSDGSRGGDSRYDVYLHSFSGAYGVTFAEGPSSQYPGRNAYYSHINIDPDFSGFPNTPDENAQVTAVHELFHAVQFAYNVSTASWLKETTSTWSEEILYPAVNDYISYLSSVLSFPHLSITSTNSVHEYGNCIWLHHMTQSKDQSLVREIWEESITFGALTSINNALNAYDASETIATDFNEYLVWNYFTGSRGNTNISSYAEATAYPPVSIYAFHDDYPVENASVSTTKYPEGYAANYLRFQPSTTPKQNLLLLLDGADNGDWYYQVITRTGSSYTYHSGQSGDGVGDATIFVNDWLNRDEAIVIVSPNMNTSAGQEYRYTALETDYAVYFEESIASDATGGNNNGQIEPGETATLAATFTNYGQNLSNVTWQATTADPQISMVDSTASYSSFNTNQTLTNSDQPFSFAVSSDANPHLVTFTIQILEGQNVVVEEVARVLVGYPELLLVDDQSDEDGQVLRDALDELGVAYDTRVRSEDDLSSFQFELRNTLIWTTGEQYADPLSAEERDSLKSFLESGGRLLLFGNKIAFNNRTSQFVREYLRIDHEGFTSQSAFLSGIANDPVSQGSYLGKGSTQYPSDVVSPVEDPYVSDVWKFSMESKPGVIKVNNGLYRIVFFTFPFSAITSSNTAFITPEEAVQRALDWLADTTNTAPEVPELLAPTPDDHITIQNADNEEVVFTWYTGVDSDSDPLRYTLQLDTSDAFMTGNILFQRDITDTTITFSAVLLDTLLVPGGDSLRFYWRIHADDYSAVSTSVINSFTASADSIESAFADRRSNIPGEYKLYPNFPNPFNPQTTIAYDLPVDTRVRVDVYDVKGRLVNSLVTGFQSAGSYEIQWNGKDEEGRFLGSGIYFVRIAADKFSSVEKMTLLR